MKLVDYDHIINYLEEHTCRCSRAVLCDVLEKFTYLGSHDTLLSIFLNRVQRNVRFSFNSKMKGDSSNLYFQLYKEMVEENLKTGLDSHILVRLSNKFQIPPGLMARLIIEQFLQHEFVQSKTPAMHASDERNAGSGFNGKELLQSKIPSSAFVSNQASETRMNTFSFKQTVSAWMKNPNLITDGILREQVLQCISYDVCYGPINDAIRHSVGLEFEIKLRNSVVALKVPFLDENDLRKRGYDKTPDIKLEIPIVVRGHPICWIESKASFGDLETHGEYVQGQYLSYWNRFGPGLVIYWFGFIDEVFDDMKKQGILIMDCFPGIEDVVLMDP